jgi:hypothetical protein
LSTTVTVCVEVAVLFPSVAVQVTVFGPFTKLAGDVTVTVVQLSGLGAVGENWHRYKLPSHLRLL